MRTKPRGRTWRRKRRKNSCEESVIFLFLISVRIILPAEGNLVMLEGHKPVVGDGDTMGVAGEVTQHMMRSGNKLAAENPTEDADG
jgi:hypothetical protein